MAIDPRHLQIVLDVARTGSFSAAARLRNVSQPALSVAVAQLERQLGFVLLERSRRGVTLTPAGEILRRRAEAVEQQLAAAEHEVSLSNTEVLGPLVVGGTPGVLACLVPAALRLLSSEGRHFSLKIVEASDPELNQMLRSGQIDFALSTVGVDPPPPDLDELEVEGDALQVVVGLNHPIAAAEIELQELANEAWVLPSVGGVYLRQVEALFLANQVPFPHALVRCDSLATTKEIVRQSDYVTVFPSKVVAGEIAAGLLRNIPLKGRGLVRRVGVRRFAGNVSSPAALAFIGAIRASAGLDASS